MWIVGPQPPRLAVRRQASRGGRSPSAAPSDSQGTLTSTLLDRGFRRTLLISGLLIAALSSAMSASGAPAAPAAGVHDGPRAGSAQAP